MRSVRYRMQAAFEFYDVWLSKFILIMFYSVLLILNVFSNLAFLYYDYSKFSLCAMKLMSSALNKPIKKIKNMIDHFICTLSRDNVYIKWLSNKKKIN